LGCEFSLGPSFSPIPSRSCSCSATHRRRHPGKKLMINGFYSQNGRGPNPLEVLKIMN
jgi:hypothetical protein